MKKLLALILCVMMFVAIIPTAAFAAPPATTYVGPLHDASVTNKPIHSEMTYKAASDAISHAKANIDYMYGTLAANNAVFGTVKGMDDVVNGLVTDMFDGTSGYIKGVPVGTIKDNVKLYMKDIIGGSVIEYLNENWTDFATASTSRKAAADTQTLTFTGTTVKDSSGTPVAWIFKGPAGKLYLQDTGDNWYTTNSSYDKISKLSTVPGGSGTTRTLAVDKSGLTYTGNTFIDPTTKHLNYVYTGANGQIYALDSKDDTWQKTDDVMKTVLDGKATWADGDVTVTTTYKYDPIKYAQTFADAVNDAFTSKEGAANLEAIMYQLYWAKVWKGVNDELDDLRDDIKDWENGSSVLDDYHFNEYLFTPYAFMNEDWYPENFTDLPAAIFAP